MYPRSQAKGTQSSQTRRCHASYGLTKEQEKEDEEGDRLPGERNRERGGGNQEVARAEGGKEGRRKGGGRSMEGRRKEDEDAAVRRVWVGPSGWAPPLSCGLGTLCPS